VICFAESRLAGSHRRYQSSYSGSLSRGGRYADTSEAAYFRDFSRRNDPEAVIRAFESQPSLHTNPAAVAEYVKALVKVDRLDGSELLRTLQRGPFWINFLHNNAMENYCCSVSDLF